ncbi:MAG: helix-turn-helix domain-containing protein [Candidatus Acidiferrales bacterium]
MSENLTVREVCTILRLSKNAVLKYIRSGTLPAALVGRKFIISASDVTAFIDARRVTTSS